MPSWITLFVAQSSVQVVEHHAQLQDNHKQQYNY